MTLPWFVCNSVEPNWARGRASGFSPRAAVDVGRRGWPQVGCFRRASAALSWLRWNFPFFGGQKKKRKEEEMNKRLNLAWKTLAHCEPDSWGGSATLWVKCLGGFMCRSVKAGKMWRINLLTSKHGMPEEVFVCIYIYIYIYIYILFSWHLALWRGSS